MRVEVDEPDGPVRGGAGTDVGLCDRVVAAQDDRDRACGEHLSDRGLDRLVRPARVRRQHGRVAEVDHPQLRKGVDLRLEVGARGTARRANRSRPEAGTRAVGDEIVGRGPDDGDVDTFELGGILGVGQPTESRQAGEVRLLAVFAPALERVDHSGILLGLPLKAPPPRVGSRARLASGPAR